MADGNLIQQVSILKNIYSPYIASDPFYQKDYGWSINDFTKSFNSKLSGHVKIGLIPYIKTRLSIARSQLDAISRTDQELISDKIRIYPNPVFDYLVIEQPDPAARFTIFGVSGSVVLGGFLADASTRINIADLPDGVYYLRVSPVGGVTRIMILH
jgi:hypothetical protein